MKESLHITVHAEKRFLQRILKSDDLSIPMLKRAGHWLSQELDMTKSYNNGRYRLPSFPEFYAVIHDNTLVTIKGG